MKKLLISIVATASLALVAKADGALRNATSFEDYGDSFAVDKAEGGQYYWSGGGTEGNEGVFEIKALDGTEGNLSAKPDDVARPKYWANQTGDDLKALAIDTDVALARHVATKDAEPQDIGTGLYFDSMVQFTATDTPPDVKANDTDKLVIWLKETAVAATEEGGDSSTDPTYTLCVTAGDWQEGQKPSAKVYENANSEITVRNGEWCRLTISVTKGSDEYPRFRIFINGKPFADVNGVEEFLSLTEDALDAQTITSVSFQGKGAIDDLVWTTEDPFYVAPVIEKVNVSVAINDFDAIQAALFDSQDSITSGTTAWECDKNSSHTIMFMLKEGYQLVSSSPEAAFEDGIYIITVQPDSDTTVTIVTAPVEEPVANFTVGGKPFAAFADAIAEVAQNGGTIKIATDATDESLVLNETIEITADTTINFNDKTLKSTADPAIAVLGGTLDLTGNGGITAPGVVIWQGEKNANPVTVTTVNVGEGVTILSKNDEDGDNAVLMYGNATLNVAGTLETYSKGFAALQNSGNDKNANVKITITGTVINHNEAAIGMNTDKTAEATLTVEEGAVVTGATAIYAKSGTVVIKGGMITGTGAAVDFVPGQVGGKVTGDALVVEANNNYKAVSVTVTGGTFVSNNAKAIASYATPDATALAGFVSGGQFNTEIDAALLGESENGKELELVAAETAGYWTVAEKQADETPKFGDEAYNPEDVDQNGEWTAVNSSSVITVPTDWELDIEENTITKGAVVIKIPGYYSITPAQGGGYSLALNETARPTVAAEGATKPMEFVTEGNEEVVKLNVPNIKPRLYYSVVYADDVKFTKNMVKTNPVQGAVPSAPKGTNGRFFKVVVTDVPDQN